MNISELKVNEVKMVTETAKLGEELSHMFRQRGLHIGAKVELKRKIYKGKLLIIEANQVELCIRKIDAEKIEVE